MRITEIIKDSFDLIKDGWGNIMGGVDFGKRSTIRSYSFSKIQEETKWRLFTFDKMVTKIMNLVPKTALKKPITLLNVDPEIGQEIHNLLDKIDFHTQLMTAWTYARLMGGAVWIPEIVDGRELTKPLNYNNIKNIDKGQIITLDKCYLMQNDNEYLYLYSANVKKIHISRVFIFKGEDTDNDISYTYYNGFGASLLDAIFEDIYNYHLAHETPPKLLLDYSRAVYKLKDLNKKIATKQEDEIKRKVSLIHSVANTSNATVLDTEDDYLRVNINPTNIDTLVYETERKLCTLTNIPHTLLLNEAPEGGLSNNGKQQQIDFYDFVTFERNFKLTYNIKKFLFIVQNYFKLSDNLDFEFANLYELDELEKAKLKKEKAETTSKIIANIVSIVENQIISPDEARALLMKQENLIDDEARNILNEGSWQ